MLSSLPRERMVVAISYGCMGRSLSVDRTASASGLETGRRPAICSSLVHIIDTVAYIRVRVYGCVYTLASIRPQACCHPSGMGGDGSGGAAGGWVCQVAECGGGPGLGGRPVVVCTGGPGWEDGWPVHGRSGVPVGRMGAAGCSTDPLGGWVQRGAAVTRWEDGWPVPGRRGGPGLGMLCRRRDAAVVPVGRMGWWPGWTAASPCGRGGPRARPARLAWTRPPGPQRRGSLP